MNKLSIGPWKGLAHVITDNIDKDLEDEVRDVADGCPVGAIEIK